MMHKRTRFAWKHAFPLAGSRQIAIAVLLGCMLHLLFAPRLFAQTGPDKLIKLEVKHEPLKAALAKLEVLAGMRVAYPPEQVEMYPDVSLVAGTRTVRATLELLLKDTKLKFAFTSNNIVISMKNTVKGVVINEKGEPMEGVSVQVLGAAIGMNTKENGEYSLEGVGDKNILTFSYAGYADQTINIGKIGNAPVQLIPVESKLDEVTVIGYGFSSKRKSTGSVGSVTAEEISKQPVANVLAALPGRVAGTLVAQNNGLPGAAVQIQIRGQGSLSSGTIPLYVIDGVPFTNFNGGIPATDNLNAFGTSGANGGVSPFSTINPADIERIDILKDADATSIYGSRGANGVILITTKKGKAGKTKLDVNYNTGFSQLNRFIPVLDLKEYLALRREAFKNDNVVPTVATAPDLLVWDTTKATRWQETFLGGTGHINDVQATLSGGDARTRFLFNSGYRKESTVFPGDNSDKRFVTRLNVDHNSADRRFGANLGVSYTNANTDIPTSDISSIYNLPPNLPLYDTAGKLFWGGGFTNPYGTLLRRYKGVTTNMTGSANLRYTILPGLNIKANFGYTRTELDQKTATPASSQNPANNPGSSAVFSNNKASNWIIEPTAEYTTKISEGKLSVLLGASWQHNTSNGYFINGANYSSEALLGTLSAAGTTTVSYNNIVEYKYSAGFGRINYDWNGKYVVNATFRRDGSSRFGPGNRFGNFGAIGASWVFSQENFVRNNLPFLSFGKLRGSYGSTGNDQISNYIYLPLYTTTTAYLGTSAIYPVTLPNAGIQWETTKKLEAALELGFIRDRILLTVNFYRNRSGNQITYLRVPTQSGYNSIQANLPALIENSGWEADLNTTNIKAGDFSWNTSFNITVPKNKLLDFPGLANTFSSGSYIVGEPINFSRIYHFTGVDPATGRATYEDMDKDGAITTNDRYIAKIGTPYYGGLSNTFSYKGLQLDIFFQFNHRYGITNVISGRPGTLTNQNRSVLDRWRQAGDVATMPGATATSGTPINNSYTQYTSSDAVWGDASYLKFRSAALAYNLPRNWLRAVKMTNCRVFAQGQNLFTWSKNRNIFDTETTVQGGPSGLGTGTIGQVLPPLRTIIFGINCSF